MSDSSPFGEPDPDGEEPFGAINFFVQDLMRMFTSGSAGPWEQAYQISASVATEGQAEPNIDPSARLDIEALTRVAELHVSEVTGLGAEAPVTIEALNRTQWARRFLDDERSLLEGLSDSIGAAVRAQLQQFQQEPDSESMFGVPGLPYEQMMQQMMAMLGPMMLGVMAGGTAGQLAIRAFGCYEFPLPRPENRSIPLVLTNIDSFAEAWSLPVDGIRLWVCVSDVAHHRVLAIPHVRNQLLSLLDAYVSSFNTDPDEVERRIRDLDLGDAEFGSEPELEILQNLTSNPDLLLGAIQSDRQRLLMGQITTLVATIEGYVDWVVDVIGTRMIPDFARITEALRRRRVEATAANRYLERLLGLELSQATFDLGSAFVDGVITRAGSDALEQLWLDENSLPTRADMDAPGLWLARIGIESTEMEIDELGDLDIPDYPDLDL